MAYTKPTLNEYGLQLPTYQDIIDYYKNKCEEIYGEDIYLGDDSQDYQFLSMFALLVYDIGQCILLDYNSHNPTTAIGTALDRVAALCGITRLEGTPSKVVLRCSGTVGTVVEYGAAQDQNGNTWQLEKYFVIGDNGYIDVEASCLVDGAIQAAKNTITIIKTPTNGWLSVTNPQAAQIGTETETDAHLRARLIYSASKASQTVLEGLKAALWDVSGVTRVKLYENFTPELDSNNIPGHSIAVIIQGGDKNDIAETIYYKKTPGTGLHGTEAVNISIEGGQQVSVRFSYVETVTSNIQVKITKISEDYSATSTEDIKNNIISATNELDIGQPLYAGNLYSAVLAAIEDVSNPTFFVNSITVNNGDILSCNYNQLIVTDIEHITVTVA